MVSRRLLITTNILALFLVGCSAKYQCETTKTGVCASVEDTYEAVYSAGTSKPNRAIGNASTKQTTSPRSIFPMREPEKVYRVWIKDYEDENGLLISNHYIYVVVNGKWLIGNKHEKRAFISDIDYDEKIRNYLIQKGKLKPPEEDSDDYDEDF